MAFLPDDAIDPGAIQSRTVAVVGYGNQGRAHALNLRDQGVRVVVGARAEGKSSRQARDDGFQPLAPAEAIREADVVMMTIADGAIPIVYAQVESAFRPGAALLFAHGFNVRFGWIEPRADLDVGLVSPKGPGRWLRERFVAGSGLAALVAVERDGSGVAASIVRAYAWGIGCARVGLIETTFAEETESDLFGEQAVLCGGIPGLLRAGYETLVEAGVRPEVAYFECVVEAKLILDLVFEEGLAGMRAKISDTAQWGGLLAEDRVVGPEARRAMAELLAEIRDGSFAARWADENRSGLAELRRRRQEESAHRMEPVGRELRKRIV